MPCILQLAVKAVFMEPGSCTRTARHAVRAFALEASSVRSDHPKRKGAGTGGAYERYAKDNERGTEPQWGGSS